MSNYSIYFDFYTSSLKLSKKKIEIFENLFLKRKRIMNTLMKEIEKNINNSVNKFIEVVAEKYDLDSLELLELWKSDVSPTKNNVAKSIPKAASVKSDVSSTESCDGCPYIYTKGEKEGQTCNIKPKGGVVYCTRHKKYEGQEPKQKKIMPTIKKSISGNISGLKKTSPSKPVNTVLRKNKAIEKLWHSTTGMVFKSAKERIVIGKCVEDKLLPLTSEDIEVCMAHSFAYEIVDKEVVPDKKIEDEESSSDDEVEKKKAPESSSNKIVPAKKSIAASIATTKLQAEDVEAILSELQLKPQKKFQKSKVESEEEIEEESEEEIEEEEEFDE